MTLIALLLSIFDFLHNHFTKANIWPNVIKIICERSRHSTPHAAAKPSTPYACGAQHALLPVVVGAMNIHNVRDRRQTSSDVRRASLLNASAPIINGMV